MAVRLSYQFNNLLGTVYRQGNLVFSGDGNMLYSAVGNRVSGFDLVRSRCFTFPFEARRNIARIALSPDGARVPEALQGRYAEHGHLRVLRLVDLVGSEDRGGGRLCLPRSLAALELGGDGARLRQLLSHDDFGVHASSVVLGKGAKKCSVYSLVTDSLLSAGAPSCILSTRPGAEFAARAARATLDAARVATANRARLRARLPNLLLDWAALVQDGIEADGLCAAALGLGGDRNRVDVQYLYNWALRHSLLLMERCLALDVHLELIASPKELEQVFWYWEYLLAARGTVASSAARHRVVTVSYTHLTLPTKA